MILFFFLLLGFLLILGWRFVQMVRRPPISRYRGGSVPLNVCVVLGSGGHTSEMMRAIKALSLDMWRANRPFYVVSETDKHSASIAVEFETVNFRRCCRLHNIPRAREVGQSYFLSIFSTLRAIWWSLFLIISEKPDVILVNGPGVCVPVVVTALLVAFFSPSWYYRRPAIAFMESFTCVYHLSLSGRLLIPFCDVWTVHWQSLYDAYMKRRWGRNGSLFFVGTAKNEEEMPRLTTPQQLAEHSSNNEPFAIVTVGSTQFNALIEAVDDDEVLRALSKLGIKRLFIQKGASSHEVRLSNAHGITIEVFSYRPKLQEMIRDAALVISHAGAGTILEVLEFKRPLIVVPNRSLMVDHQVELAEALSSSHYLFCLQVWEFCKELQTLDFNTLREFPGANTTALREALLPLFGL
ncbi:putative glycosyltransferase family 28 protein [Trypanosoma theileri]|uniref:UDP-N-acetylglucosamine transferase subunit ALG14 n=1 Tax=Trypanosoma theileri TaxID=67003 RepID=A0A1X0P2G9_9TRYP|nr:putative glycosyltransferase family 28 protein [Trypanosoma theileri]ORC91028.1 putative glycosyltransferase family 28 protein [Trypanosoma theileri]